MTPWARDEATERLLDEFLDHCEHIGGLAPRTRINYQSSVRNFAAWWRERGSGELAEVTPADIEAWLLRETDRGCRPRTRECSLYALRAFYRWLDRDGPNPADAVRRPRIPPRRVVPYRPPEARRILAALATRSGASARFDLAVVATLRFTGMRLAELTGLRHDRLDLDRRRAKVVGKGSKPRVVPLPLPLMEVLTGYLEDVRPTLPASSYVFANPRGIPGSTHAGRVDRQGVLALTARAGRRAEVAGPHHPHRWRHSYATELLRAGVDLHVVQRLLGHSQLETTTRYLHLVDADLRDAIDLTYPQRPRRRLAPPQHGEQLSLDAG